MPSLKYNLSPKVVNKGFNFKGIDIDLNYLISIKKLTARTKRSYQPNYQQSYAGDCVSRRRGQGMEFDEVRIYQAGDDIRAMDWRVTARTGKAHTKLFIEEKEQSIYFIVNLSKSMRFGSKRTFKSILATELCAFYAWQACMQQHKVGALIFNESRHQFIKAQRGSQGVMTIFQNLLMLKEAPKENSDTVFLEGLLRQYINKLQKGNKIIILSDFLNLKSPVMQNTLKQLAQKSHLCLLNIYDILEAQAPSPNEYLITDGHNTLAFDSRSESFRENYRRSFLDKIETLKTFCQANKIQYQSIKANDDVLLELKKAALI